MNDINSRVLFLELVVRYFIVNIVCLCTIYQDHYRSFFQGLLRSLFLPVQVSYVPIFKCCPVLVELYSIFSKQVCKLMFIILPSESLI